MYRTWKSVLYDYVHNKNETEINHSPDAVYSLLTDEYIFRKQQEILSRIWQRHDERGSRPVRNETRLGLRNITEQGNKVIVDIDMRKRHSYEIRHNHHEQQTIDQERITLFNQGGRWRISKIEEYSPERTPASHPLYSDPFNISKIQSDALPKSMPYLNRDLLTSNESPARRIKYNRVKAQQYADTWWNRGNPKFLHFDVDCSNYVSQCLFAGGAPMNYTGRRESGWWYQGRSGNKEMWSFSWSVAHSLQLFLGTSNSGLRAEAADSPEQLTIGDVIIYDWDGDHKYQHSVIVTAADANGMPLVNAHTSDSKHRYWDYRDSYAWSTNTTYRFFHITDLF